MCFGRLAVSATNHCLLAADRHVTNPAKQWNELNASVGVSFGLSPTKAGGIERLEIHELEKPPRFTQWEIAGPAILSSDASNWLAPFHTICTPMHTRRNDESFTITFIPVGPITTANRSANA